MLNSRLRSIIRNGAGWLAEFYRRKEGAGRRTAGSASNASVWGHASSRFRYGHYKRNAQSNSATQRCQPKGGTCIKKKYIYIYAQVHKYIYMYSYTHIHIYKKLFRLSKSTHIIFFVSTFLSSQL